MIEIWSPPNTNIDVTINVVSIRFLLYDVERVDEWLRIVTHVGKEDVCDSSCGDPLVIQKITVPLTPELFEVKSSDCPERKM